MQLCQHTTGGAADQDGAVIHGVGLHPALGHGGDFHQRLTSQEVDQVQPMRRQVHHRAATRTLGVGPPVVGGEAGIDPAGIDDADGGDGADGACGDGGAHRRMGGVVALVEGGAVGDGGGADGAGHRLGIDQRGGHGFFAKHGLAGGGGGFDTGAMQMVGRGDVDCIHARVSQQRGDPLIGPRPQRGTGLTRLRVRVGDRRESPPGGGDRRRGIVPGDPAEPQNAPAQRGHAHHRSGRCTSSRRRA